jgi:MGT family glycosyltransferase
LHYLLAASDSFAEAFKLAITFVNMTRGTLGVEPLDEQSDLHKQLWARCDRVLMASITELDTSTANLLPNLRYVGPIFEPDPAPWEWDLPWPSNTEPLVLVSFSTTYQHQEEQLQRAIDAVASLPVHAVITTGPEIDPGDLDVPPSPNLAVRDWIPHTAILPGANVVLTHAGHSTVMAALAHGVPMVCLPTGRDQPVTAARIQELGAGIALDADADVPKIQNALRETIHTHNTRAGARELAVAIANATADDPAVSEVEQLLP